MIISINQLSLSWIWMILGNYIAFAAITLILTLKRWPLRPASRSNRSSTQMRVNVSKKKILSEKKGVMVLQCNVWDWCFLSKIFKEINIKKTSPKIGVISKKTEHQLGMWSSKIYLS